MRYAVFLLAALGGTVFVAAPAPFPAPFGVPGGDRTPPARSEKALLLLRAERMERRDASKPAREGPRARGGRGRSLTPGARGELRLARGGTEAIGEGPLVRVAVEVEGGVSADTAAFARMVERVLGDARGWGAARSFRRVHSEPFDLRIALASPALTDRLCAPLQTNGIFSCAAGSRAVLNVRRWREGAPAYGSDRRRYRIYMLNHEIGHVLGRGHAGCPSRGARAPVMMQQTKGVAPCLPNPWPLAPERN